MFYHPFHSHGSGRAKCYQVYIGMSILCRIDLEIQQWLEGTLSKVTKHNHQVGLLNPLKCSNLAVMVTCSSLEHTLVHHLSMVCLSRLTLAILNRLLVGMPKTGTSQLPHKVSRLLRELGTTIMANSPHPSSSSSSSQLVGHQLIILFTTIVRPPLLVDMVNKGTLRMGMGVDIKPHQPNMVMASHQQILPLGMTSSMVMVLQQAMAM